MVAVKACICHVQSSRVSSHPTLKLRVVLSFRIYIKNKCFHLSLVCNLLQINIMTSINT